MLVRGAYSSNIKERRDCSAALFDADGRMVAQAEHIPVHLGAMPEAVGRGAGARARARATSSMLNDPYRGGTHLPDITARLAGRARRRDRRLRRHARAPLRRRRDEPGLDARRLARRSTRRASSSRRCGSCAGGELVDDVLDLVLANVRTPERAARRPARAARREPRRRGARWTSWSSGAGATLVRGRLRRGARLRRAAHARGDRRAAGRDATAREGELEGDGVTDDDIPIAVAVDDRRRRAARSTSRAPPAQVAGNVNCPLAVTRSACLFALRVAAARRRPGQRRHLRAADGRGARGLARQRPQPGRRRRRQRRDLASASPTPSCCAPRRRRSTLPAQGQGTMNNLVIGGAGWTYYETIGGGQGGEPAGAGDSGVHVGMTNTLNTPVEALELEFPLRVERYELRGGSRRRGRAPRRRRHRAGDARARARGRPLLTDRRRHAPQGAAGRRGRPAGRELRRGRGAAGEGAPRAAPGRRRRGAHAGRRRLGRAVGDHSFVRPPRPRSGSTGSAVSPPAPCRTPPARRRAGRRPGRRRPGAGRRAARGPLRPAGRAARRGRSTGA